MYTPSPQILDKYADLMINFALRSGDGIKKGDVVYLEIPECAKPLLFSLHKKILEAWAHPIIKYIPDGLNKQFFELASQEQLSYVNEAYTNGLVQASTHRIRILAEHDKHELNKIPGYKITTHRKAQTSFREQVFKKKLNGNLSRTLCLYGTLAMAQEANLSLKEYREQIIYACYLDDPDPVQTRQKIQQQNRNIQNKLTALQIEKMHITWKDIDLNIRIWKDKKRLGGRGSNIPSFEVFTSPDRRETEGHIKFSEPLYIYGQLIKDIYLEFKEWRVVKAIASENQQLLDELLKIKNADKLWEFSLTDKRMSRISKFMAETLYDENTWWPFGNMHIAIWWSFKDAYNPVETDNNISHKKNIVNLTEQERQNLGFNQCIEHKDIVTTQDRVVTATLANGEEKVIYKEGIFQL